MADRRSFAGLVITQFLGALNDNFFKQLVLLLCAATVVPGGTDFQSLAMAAFALPFVLFSGVAGHLSDRFSKRSLIVGCKAWEILVMAAGLAVFAFTSAGSQSELLALVFVLAVMGTQSAFFGPPKYGILPELFPERTLGIVNGVIQMTTFLAIILGTAIAGITLDKLQGRMWICSAIAVGIAVVGTLTSCFVQPTPRAAPDQKFSAAHFFGSGDVWRFILGNRSIRWSVLVVSMFWFVGGIAQPAINMVGERILEVSRTRTSLMAAFIGVGITIGCAGAGWLMGAIRGKVLVAFGSGGIVASLCWIAFLCFQSTPVPKPIDPETTWQALTSFTPLEGGLRLGMLCLGLASGFFVVPIQVLLQTAPPARLKGRVIGVMNLCTWTGIVLSAAGFAVYGQYVRLNFEGKDTPRSAGELFLCLAAAMLLVALFYRLPESETVGGESAAASELPPAE